MSAPAAHPVEAAMRARRQATAVAAVGAVVPTVLAAQGMTYLAVDLLGFPLLAAVALAGFLELALVASALLARAAALAGRTAGADAVAVWVVSGTSGLLAGVHELMVTAPDGTTTWNADPGSVLAALVRVVAPLVAAWLWERVLQAARAEQAERTLAEMRRDRRFLEVARAALAVRRLDEAGHVSGRRARRAARRLDRAHVAALRTAPPAPTLEAVLHAVGQVDHLPAATAVAPLDGVRHDVNTVAGDRPNTVAMPDESTPGALLSEAVRTAGHRPDTGAVADDNMAIPGVRLSIESDDMAGNRPDTGAQAGDVEGAPGVLVVEGVQTAGHGPDTAVPPLEAVSVVADLTKDTVADDRTPIVVDGPRLPMVLAAHTRSTPTVTAHVSDAPDTMTLALEVVRANPSVSGAALADELTRRGRPVSTRSGQRWRARALDELDAQASPVEVAAGG